MGDDLTPDQKTGLQNLMLSGDARRILEAAALTPEQHALALKMCRAGIFPSIAVRRALENRDVSPVAPRGRRMITFEDTEP